MTSKSRFMTGSYRRCGAWAILPPAVRHCASDSAVAHSRRAAVRRNVADAAAQCRHDGRVARPLLPTIVGTIAACGLLAAARAADGRWEGQALVPGMSVPVIVDLAPAGGGNRWIGSVTLPGRGVRGTALQSLVVQDDVVRGQTTAAPGRPPGGEIAFELHRGAAQSLVGELRQGGHAAPLTLQRTGPAQVETPPFGTPIPATLRGIWVGRYDIGFGPRDVTLKLDAAADGSAPVATMRVVGRRTFDLAIDFIAQRGAWVTLAVTEPGISLDGPWALEGEQWKLTWRQGPFESPLVLRRAP
jgi:hypothetical protein